MSTYYIGADVHSNSTELAIEKRGKIGVFRIMRRLDCTKKDMTLYYVEKIKPHREIKPCPTVSYTIPLV